MLIECKTVSFGTIRNNTALKHNGKATNQKVSFGTIRNNTALKLVARYIDE